MMATWFWILSVLIYFQDTTSTSVPVPLQYAPKCEGLRCHQQAQYQVLQPQYLLQPQTIQQQEYQHPVIVAKSYPKCPFGHSIEHQQLYEINDQQKQLQNLQNFQAQLQYQSQEQKQQQQQQAYQVSYQQTIGGYKQKDNQASYQQLNKISLQQLLDAELQKYQANQAYQQKNYQSSYQQLSKDLQQGGLEAVYQNTNKGYLPPQVSNDIYQTSYQSSQKESQNSQIHQQLISNINIQKDYESLRQHFNNAHLSSQIQQQQLLNANVQQNEHVKTELSQEHQGKIKQTINYDVSHQHQGYNQHQGFNLHQSNSNIYNQAKSSTNIERHHPIHHHSDGAYDESEEIDIETGKKKKDHDAYYKFQYAVNDQHTGDIKSHKEERAGDEVKGEYSLVEKDGNVRTVKYFADWKTGFHATVHNSKPRN
ncbi:transcription factor SPT20 homolog [Harmonia axyridis]|uniref:transcription factor SPT20 homolog n=1 Tax=Harmonia axyridis TaxID=115357 RepID=UPI001E276A15|nr:transcription factor SPT20 homolog [Harmonia axyridis]